MQLLPASFLPAGGRRSAGPRRAEPASPGAVPALSAAAPGGRPDVPRHGPCQLPVSPSARHARRFPRRRGGTPTRASCSFKATTLRCPISRRDSTMRSPGPAVGGLKICAPPTSAARTRRLCPPCRAISASACSSAVSAHLPGRAVTAGRPAGGSGRVWGSTTWTSKAICTFGSYKHSPTHAPSPQACRRRPAARSRPVSPISTLVVFAIPKITSQLPQAYCGS